MISLGLRCCAKSKSYVFKMVRPLLSLGLINLENSCSSDLHLLGFLVCARYGFDLYFCERISIWLHRLV